MNIYDIRILTAHDSRLDFRFVFEEVHYACYVLKNSNNEWELDTLFYYMETGKEYIDNPADETRIALIKMFNSVPKFMKHTNGNKIK